MAKKLGLLLTIYNEKITFVLQKRQVLKGVKRAGSGYFGREGKSKKSGHLGSKKRGFLIPLGIKIPL